MGGDKEMRRDSEINGKRDIVTDGRRERETGERREQRDKWEERQR